MWLWVAVMALCLVHPVKPTFNLRSHTLSPSLVSLRPNDAIVISYER